jgi:hypothetical protein
MKSHALILTALLIAPTHAQLKPRLRFTLNPDHLTQTIIKSLAQNGTITDATQITLLGNVIASEPDPALDVRSVTTLHNTSAIQLTCHNPAACLPFYVLANITPTALRKPTPPIVMRSNTSATLLIDDGRTHLKLSVTTLQSGATGDIIRARTADHKHIYSAEVINPTTLRGTF